MSYKTLTTDEALLKEMEIDVLLQAFTGIVKSEKYVELYPIMDEIHTSLMEVAN